MTYHVETNIRVMYTYYFFFFVLYTNLSICQSSYHTGRVIFMVTWKISIVVTFIHLADNCQVYNVRPMRGISNFFFFLYQDTWDVEKSNLEQISGPYVVYVCARVWWIKSDLSSAQVKFGTQVLDWQSSLFGFLESAMKYKKPADELDCVNSVKA